MKILFISSGYQRIYSYFDQCILDRFISFPGVIVGYFTLLHDFARFKLICDQFKPDMVFTMLGDNLPKNTLEWIKKQSFRSILWLTEDPYYIDRSMKVIPYFDFIFSIDSAAVDYYKSQQYKNVYHLSLGTDPEVFSPISNINKTSDICLVGYPYPDRVRLVLLILEETPFRIQVVGNKWKKQLFRNVSSTNLSLIDRWVPPGRAAHIYCSAKVVLNTHRPYNEKTNQNSVGILNRSLNNRTFDIASCGTFQLIQFMDELAQNFEEHKEIVSFQTDEELIDKLRYYLSNETERHSIAAEGRNKVLLHHTFHHRLSTIIASI